MKLYPVFALILLCACQDSIPAPELSPATEHPRIFITSAGPSPIYMDTVPRVYGEQGTRLFTTNPCHSITDLNTVYSELDTGKAFVWNWNGRLFDEQCTEYEPKEDSLTVMFCHAEYPWLIEKPAHHACDTFEVATTSATIARAEVEFQAQRTTDIPISITNTTDQPIRLNMDDVSSWLTAKVAGYRLRDFRLNRNAPKEILPGKTGIFYLHFNDFSDPNSIECGVFMPMVETDFELCVGPTCNRQTWKDGTLEIEF